MNDEAAIRDKFEELKESKRLKHQDRRNEKERYGTQISTQGEIAPDDETLFSWHNVVFE